jgi:hypothetical protein
MENKKIYDMVKEEHKTQSKVMYMKKLQRKMKKQVIDACTQIDCAHINKIDRTNEICDKYLYKLKETEQEYNRCLIRFIARVNELKHQENITIFRSEIIHLEHWIGYTEQSKTFIKNNCAIWCQ